MTNFTMVRIWPDGAHGHALSRRRGNSRRLSARAARRAGSGGKRSDLPTRIELQIVVEIQNGYPDTRNRDLSGECRIIASESLEDEEGGRLMDFFIRLYEKLVVVSIVLIIIGTGLFGAVWLNRSGLVSSLAEYIGIGLLEWDAWVAMPAGAILGAVVGILIATGVTGPFLVLLSIRTALCEQSVRPPTIGRP